MIVNEDGVRREATPEEAREIEAAESRKGTSADAREAIGRLEQKIDDVMDMLRRLMPGGKGY